MLIVQIYVDDIIFGATNENMCKEFSTSMQGEFEGGAQLFSWVTNQAIKRRNLNKSSQVHKGAPQTIWHDGIQSNNHTYEHIHQT